MTIIVATTEPLELRAGDTWQWRREDLSDYPAISWTLKYRFKSAAGGFEIVASADGLNHAVLVPAATTAAFIADRYSWIAWVEDVTPIKTTIRTGSLNVLADLRAGTAGSALDLRTPARVMLDAVEAVLKKSATFEQRRMVWDNRELERVNPAELLKLYDALKIQVQREETAANKSAGSVDSSRIFIRLQRA